MQVGSVHVPGVMEVESRATVHPLLSTITRHYGTGLQCLM